MVFKKGHIPSISTREKIGHAHRGKIVSKETREKLRISLLGKLLPKDVCEKMSKSKIGHHVSLETRKKLKDAHKRRRELGLSGRHISHGYILIKKPEHPNCHKSGYIEEHRLVMEKKLGRYLTKEEIVHHIDGIKTNNDICNLKLLTTSEHMTEHLEERGIRKISNKEADVIRKRYSSGEITMSNLAKEYGFKGKCQISAIVNYKIYKPSMLKEIL